MAPPATNARLVIEYPFTMLPSSERLDNIPIILPGFCLVWQDCAGKSIRLLLCGLDVPGSLE